MDKTLIYGMNDVTIQKIWSVLINYPRLPFAAVAKRCNVDVLDVENAAKVLGRMSSKLVR